MNKKEDTEMSVFHDKEGWHMDKRVQISDMIALALLAIAMASWTFALQGRVNLNEHDIHAIMDNDRALRLDNQREDDEIRDELRRNQQAIIQRLERIEDRITVAHSDGNGKGG